MNLYLSRYSKYKTKKEKMSDNVNKKHQKRTDRTSDKEVETVESVKKVYLMNSESAQRLVGSIGKLPTIVGNQIIKVQESYSNSSLPNITDIEQNNNYSSRFLSSK